MIELHTEQGISRYEYRVLLDQRTFTIRYDFNSRDTSWYLNLQDEDSNYLVVGQRIVGSSASNSVDLLRNKADPNMPQGNLLCYDTQNIGDDPGFADLGDRHKMYYFAPGEILAIAFGET